MTSASGVDMGRTDVCAAVPAAVLAPVAAFSAVRRVSASYVQRAFACDDKRRAGIYADARAGALGSARVAAVHRERDAVRDVEHRRGAGLDIKRGVRRCAGERRALWDDVDRVVLERLADIATADGVGRRESRARAGREKIQRYRKDRGHPAS